MKLDHLPLEQLNLSGLNVRKKNADNVDDLLPSIRRLGILQPLLVRPNCEGFEIVAGQRRFCAASILAEDGVTGPIPVIIMEDGDDATAIEASLVENIARLPMDEIDQFKAFEALRGEGLSVEEIAARFGVTERLVQQRLAIAAIIDPILNAYRREGINADTLRILTMATPRQQKAWWKLFRSEDEYAPTGRSLKNWLFGGAHVPMGNALFDVTEYKGIIISDLFGDERYFADAQAFWQMQDTAIAAKRDAYLGKGWAEIVVLDRGERFAAWEHEKTPKSKGGKVFVSVTHDGEATFHEGYLSVKEARKHKAAAGQRGEEGSKIVRAERTAAMDNYLGLQRHAAVRVELLSHPAMALRLTVAHMIAGSALWQVKPEGQRASTPEIRAEVAASKAQAAFGEERKAVLALLGIEDGGPLVDQSFGSPRSFGELFAALMKMDDAAILRILAYAMAETLEAHHGIVDTLGELLSTDMRNWWTPDEAFFGLLRNKPAINAMVRELAGDAAADANISATAKIQKKIVMDYLNGTREAKVKDWLPRYMAFPAQDYTDRAV
ncbi:ParB/RepB/Spo0J family partition protein [Nitrobacter winogradskyi]|uniref:ParB family chromosome partitioning protein n=2 Tax=Nitrobacter winogradskyi TaxID=913 RepID=A0ACC6APE5_NITWI|nr:ParB/RepB/Spo0J family partition protein [Nitrobacter winogradskyi]MCP2001161.1 ParB family chromosome partitioning protein [Nitrobacter winogradskyi]GEC17657.1 chromosome partitioning protein ParB [Nitrobacter winogradskyi]